MVIQGAYARAVILGMYTYSIWPTRSFAFDLEQPRDASRPRIIPHPRDSTATQHTTVD